MSVPPEHPDLDQARRQAKELVRAAQGGDAGALARLAAVSAPLTLAGAQLALARELGQSSWAALVREVEARTASIPENVVRFLRFSVNLQIGMAAARMLHENPALAEAGFPAAVVLATLPESRPSFAATPAPRSASTPGAAGPRCLKRRSCGSRLTCLRQAAPKSLSRCRVWLVQPRTPRVAPPSSAPRCPRCRSAFRPSASFG